jgi:uncharacterized membrane protein YjgN (DUF898 family)
MPDSITAEQVAAQKFVYDGRIGALYGIFIKILLLNIVTLSIYRFWGKTNLRRYVWSHISLQGERFEYTGTGGELFRGFLIVVGLLILTQIAITVLTLVLGPDSLVTHVTGFLFGLAVLYLSLVAIYAAQRYRLTRTSWRGIRGGMSGSAWTYGLRALGYNLLLAMTLGIIAPWVQMRLAEQRLNNSYFGDAKALLEGRSAPVFRGFLLGFLLYCVLMAVLVAALWYGLHLGDAFRQIRLSTSPDGKVDPAALHFIFTLIGAYLLFLVGVTIIGVMAFAWYAAAFFAAVAKGLSYDNLTFRSAMGPWDYGRFWLGNILILFFTLGLGFPIVVHRGLRFFADRLEIFGAIDVERLAQNTLPKPKTGEGLLETFDTGFL